MVVSLSSRAAAQQANDLSRCAAHPQPSPNLMRVQFGPPGQPSTIVAKPQKGAYSRGPRGVPGFALGPRRGQMGVASFLAGAGSCFCARSWRQPTSSSENAIPVVATRARWRESWGRRFGIGAAIDTWCCRNVRSRAPERREGGTRRNPSLLSKKRAPLDASACAESSSSPAYFGLSSEIAPLFGAKIFGTEYGRAPRGSRLFEDARVFSTWPRVPHHLTWGGRRLPSRSPKTGTP